MNKPATYFYDIEMPPPDMPMYVWLILGLLFALLLFIIVLRIFQQRQPEVLALKQLKQLAALNPYQLAAILREGLQETQLQKVLPEQMLKDLDHARYARSPELALKPLFAQAETFLQDKTATLSTAVLAKRLFAHIAAFPLKNKLQPVQAYLKFVLKDFAIFVKNQWRRFHG